MGIGTRFSFQSQLDEEPAAEEIRQRWFTDGAYQQPTSFNEAAFAPFTARELTHQLAAVFEEAINKT
jgi:hypothetical protein